MDHDLYERIRDPTINQCDFCALLYVREVPPKRPLSPFIFFSQEQRRVLKTKRPNQSTKQVMNQLQKTWRGMSDSETQRYRDMSDLDRVRYDRHRRLLKEGLGEGVENLCSCQSKQITDNRPITSKTAQEWRKNFSDTIDKHEEQKERVSRSTNLPKKVL